MSWRSGPSRSARCATWSPAAETGPAEGPPAGPEVRQERPIGRLVPARRVRGALVIDGADRRSPPGWTRSHASAGRAPWATAPGCGLLRRPRPGGRPTARPARRHLGRRPTPSPLRQARADPGRQGRAREEVEGARGPAVSRSPGMRRLACRPTRARHAPVRAVCYACSRSPSKTRRSAARSDRRPASTSRSVVCSQRSISER
jgi:hypothetical protein